MASADVLSPVHTPAPHRHTTHANFDPEADTDDQYATYKKLQRQLEYIKLQEELSLIHI